MLYVSMRTRKLLTRLALWAVAFAAAFASVAVLQNCTCEPEAAAYEEADVTAVAAAIRTLQPAADEGRAARLAEFFVAAGEESVIDPRLLVALAMRESSLHPAVEALTRRGAANELGLMQIHPRNRRALEMRPEGCDAELSTARCQITTGARWLAFSREMCPGSTWRWLVFYGSGRCRPEAEARADRTAAIAASYYVQAGGTEWR